MTQEHLSELITVAKRLFASSTQARTFCEHPVPMLYEFEREEASQLATELEATLSQLEAATNENTGMDHGECKSESMLEDLRQLLLSQANRLREIWDSHHFAAEGNVLAIDDWYEVYEECPGKADAEGTNVAEVIAQLDRSEPQPPADSTSLLQSASEYPPSTISTTTDTHHIVTCATKSFIQ